MRVFPCASLLPWVYAAWFILHRPVLVTPLVPILTARTQALCVVLANTGFWCSLDAMVLPLGQRYQLYDRQRENSKGISAPMPWQRHQSTPATTWPERGGARDRAAQDGLDMRYRRG